jgi:hypothetical protein
MQVSARRLHPHNRHAIGLVQHRALLAELLAKEVVAVPHLADAAAFPVVLGVALAAGDPALC